MKRTKGFYLSVFFSVLVLMSSAAAGWANNIPAQEGYVNDFANVFTAKEKAAIESLTKKVHADFPATKIVVLTVPEIVGDRATLARQVMSAWKLGDSDVLIMFAVSGKNANLRIDPGVKLTGILSDSRIGKIRKTMEQDLAKRRFGEGFISGIKAIHSELKSTRSTERTESGLFLFLILAVAITVFVLWRRRVNQIAETRAAMNKRISKALDGLMDISREVELLLSLAKSLSEEARTNCLKTVELLESDLLQVTMRSATNLRQSLEDLSVSEAETRLTKLERDYETLKTATDEVIQALEGAKGEKLHHPESHTGHSDVSPARSGQHEGPSRYPHHEEGRVIHHGSGSVPGSREGDGGDVNIIYVGMPGPYPGTPPFMDPTGPIDSTEHHHGAGIAPEAPGQEEAVDRRESEAPLIVDPFSSSKDEREGSFDLGAGDVVRESEISTSPSSDEREGSLTLSDPVSSEGTSY